MTESQIPLIIPNVLLVGITIFRHDFCIWPNVSPNCQRSIVWHYVRISAPRFKPSSFNAQHSTVPTRLWGYDSRALISVVGDHLTALIR